MTPRRTVAVYGNCQAQVISHIASSLPALAERFTFVSITDVAEPGRTAPALPHLADVALVWSQLDQHALRPNRDALHTAWASKVPFVRFPPVGMNAFWPFRTRDDRNAPEAGYPWGRFPIGDRIGLLVAQENVPAGRAFARYMELSNTHSHGIRRGLDRERALFARRDALCDVPMSDFIFERLHDVSLFCTHGHLRALVYRELLMRLFAASSDALRVPAAALAREIDASVEAFGDQDTVELPVHPLVIDALGLRFVDSKSRYKWFHNRWTFEEYITAYIRFDRNW